MHQAVISIKPRHVADILSGVKTIELRNRGVCIPLGSRLWIYSTLPKGRFEATAIVESVVRCSPAKAWRDSRNVLGLSWDEFSAYVNGRPEVSLIKLRSVVELKTKPTLRGIRRVARHFHPPQFFSYLALDSAVLQILTAARSGAAQ